MKSILVVNAMLPDGAYVDILLEKGKIERIDSSILCPVDIVIDAKGMLVIPGVIDGHVHLRLPGGETKETWEHASVACLLGGVTTVFDMPNTSPPLVTYDGIDAKAALIGEQPINYRFWFGATNDNMEGVARAATHPMVIGLKIYMGSSTGNLLVHEDEPLLAHFENCADQGLICGVHAESEVLIRSNQKKYKGRTLRMHDHCLIRDTEVEMADVRRALEFQRRTGVRLGLLHMSAPESVMLARGAKCRGRDVFVEVCGHHILLSCDYLHGDHGGFFKMNPPLRTQEQMEQLRRLVCEGAAVDVLSTDHAPHTIAEKMSGDVTETPSGVPGVQTQLSVLLDMVSKGEMSLARLVDLTSRNAAQIYNMEGKGEVAEGYDADLVIVDMDVAVTIRNRDMASRCEWTPFDGMTVCGRPVYTIAKGIAYDLDVVQHTRRAIPIIG